MTTTVTIAPVRKSIRVSGSRDHAFEVFTSGLGRWWPRKATVDKSPLKTAVIEPRLGGRWYELSEDGSQADVGKVLVWEPPHRLVIAWQIDGHWQYEPDLVKASEVEVRFTREADGSTRVDLEHRHLDRHGADGAAIRTAIDSEGGWAGLLAMFAAQAAKAS